ncbi:hypothetical protein BC831DRAFT_479336, partial [Entophlyctis helioformis]
PTADHVSLLVGCCQVGAGGSDCCHTCTSTTACTTTGSSRSSHGSLSTVCSASLAVSSPLVMWTCRQRLAASSLSSASSFQPLFNGAHAATSAAASASGSAPSAFTSGPFASSAPFTSSSLPSSAPTQSASLGRAGSIGTTEGETTALLTLCQIRAALGLHYGTIGIDDH